MLVEAGGKYGDNIIEKYSKKLVIEVGKKYNRRTLFRMKKFYNVFSNEKVTTLLTQLSWSHYLLLLSLNDYDEIIYYINVSKNNNLTQRQLHEKIKNKEYERLDDDTKNKLIKKEKLEVYDLIPDPIYIKSNLYNVELTEYALKQIVLNNIDEFLLQLGNGFAYIGNEYRIKIGDRYNYM